jgi:glycosyltransferase involved in cell wall biosynthesis
VRILFLTDNFPPETNAPATRTHEHSRRWAAAGHEVTVVTGVPNFPSGRIHAGYRNRPWQTETIDGVKVVRVWTYVTANQGVLKRTLDYLSFMFASIVAGLFLPRPDVVIGTSPQFFTAIAGCVLGIVRRRPFVFELRDLWPDSISAVGAMQDGLSLRLLRRLEYWLYRRAALIVSVTHSFRRILTANGIPGERIVVVRNGVDPFGFTPGPKPAELERQLGVQGKFVAAYVGTIGMAHGLGTILDAAAVLKARGRDDVAFVLVGTGAEHRKLAAEAAALSLDNVRFVGAVSKAEVKDYWRLCDVALVLLRDLPLFEHVIPSKIFEAWGTARPVILGVRGESADIVRAADGGPVITPESATALVEAIESLAAHPEQAVAAGLRGRRHAQKEFDRSELAALMLAQLEALVPGCEPAERPAPTPVRSEPAVEPVDRPQSGAKTA